MAMDDSVGVTIAQEFSEEFTKVAVKHQLRPDDPKIGRVLAAMMAAHYAACGCTHEIYKRIVQQLEDSFRGAEAQREMYH